MPRKMYRAVGEQEADELILLEWLLRERRWRWRKRLSEP